MAKYTIIRVYEVPAGSMYEATDVMREAIALHVERDYHVRDILRGPDEAPGKGRRVDLNLPRGWLAVVLDQLLGRDPTKR